MKGSKGSARKGHVVDCGDVLSRLDPRMFWHFDYCPICGDSFEDILSEDTNE